MRHVQYDVPYPATKFSIRQVWRVDWTRDSPNQPDTPTRCVTTTRITEPVQITYRYRASTVVLVALLP